MSMRCIVCTCASMAEEKENPPAKKRQLSLSLKCNHFKKLTEDLKSKLPKGNLFQTIGGLLIISNHGGLTS